MDIFDKIFTKSDADENKKKSKMLLGRLLINLRKSNHIKLYSLLEAVSDTDLVDGVLKVTIDDDVSFEMINNPKDVAVLNEVLSAIEAGLKVELFSTGRREFDPIKFENYLRQEFGKIVVIK